MSVDFDDKIFGEEVGIESGTVVGVLSNTGCAVSGSCKYRCDDDWNGMFDATIH